MHNNIDTAIQQVKDLQDHLSNNSKDTTFLNRIIKEEILKQLNTEGLNKIKEDLENLKKDYKNNNACTD